MKALSGVVLLLITGLLACGRSEPKPVDLYPEDICSYCKMAISNRLFAGEIVKEDGDVLKFDDLGCLRAETKRGNLGKPYLFFRAMEADVWVKAEDATLVKTRRVQTPMGSGMIAFEAKKKAEEFISQEGGEIVTLEDFLKDAGYHEE